MQYNVTAAEYEAAYSEYLRAVADEEAREEELIEAKYRQMYGDDADDEDEEELPAGDGRHREDWDGDESPSALAEYRFLSTRVTRPSRGDYQCVCHNISV